MALQVAPRLLAVVLVAAAATVALPHAAMAQADVSVRVRARLKEGRQLYRDLEYRKAVRVLSPVPRDPAASRAQKLEALELIGLCRVILGDEAEAREAFEDLLAIDPNYELREKSGSPKIRSFFDEVKKRYLPGYRPDARATLEHASPRGAVAGRRVELAAAVTAGVDVVKEVRLFWRRRGVLAYEGETLRRMDDARYRARFSPPADPDGYVLEYYLEARDIAGAVVARVGGPETPLSLPMRGAGPDDTPWYRRWYVWVGAGAAVVGSAVVLGLAATADDAPQGTLPPGTVDLGKR